MAATWKRRAKRPRGVQRVSMMASARSRSPATRRTLPVRQLPCPSAIIVALIAAASALVPAMTAPSAWRSRTAARSGVPARMLRRCWSPPVMESTSASRALERLVLGRVVPAAAVGDVDARGAQPGERLDVRLVDPERVAAGGRNDADALRRARVLQGAAEDGHALLRVLAPADLDERADPGGRHSRSPMNVLGSRSECVAPQRSRSPPVGTGRPPVAACGGRSEAAPQAL